MLLNKVPFLLLLVALTTTTIGRCKADVVLTKNIMNLIKTGAELSILAYEEDIPADDNHSEYTGFQFYDEEPDQALVVKTHDGYCYGAFRGTTLTWIDWSQNFDPTTSDVCVNVTTSTTTNTTNSTSTPDDVEVCCTTRNGFYEAYHTSYDIELEQAIRECAKSCSNPDECVIFTGHSQGGAIAAVAGLVMADLNPYVITFGQPPTIDAPCNLITSERWYRFINTKASDAIGITYDPVPFVPGLGADFFGHMIILSRDGSGVAYIGLDAQEFFSPLDVAGFSAHGMKAAAVSNSSTGTPGYLDRIETLMANDTYPIRNSGYVAGSLCSKDSECESQNCGEETTFAFARCIGTMCTTDDECANITGRCDSGLCISKLGSCFDCDEDSDCTGSKCLLFKCSAQNSSLMSDNCICRTGEDCESGRCEGLAPPQCEAQLAVGGSCNENSDCLSDFCSWGFICEEKDAVVDVLPNETAVTSVSRSFNLGDYVGDDDYDDESMSFGGIALIVLVVAVVGSAAFVYIPKLIARCKGYQDVPTTTMTV
uniref:Fungal lipase-type domain-containing protein n=2 Tax=Grammatophora oceanica TaxID=210454 RepID=A0A7S1UZX3_9STRA